MNSLSANSSSLTRYVYVLQLCVYSIVHEHKLVNTFLLCSLTFDRTKELYRFMFYDRFSELCKQKGVKPSKAAEECNINKSNVSNWKNHGYVPRGEALNRISAYFGVSTDYLLGNEQKEKPSGEAEGQEVTFDDFTYAMHDETKELTDENKQKLLEMARFFKEQQDKKKKQ